MYQLLNIQCTSHITQNDFCINKAEEGGDAVASLTDDNEVYAKSGK